MSDNDITVKMPGGKLNYRVGAIIVDGGEILMARNGGSPFFTVGGRVRFGESARDALLREAFEETQIRLEIDRLAYVHENFFAFDDGEFCHEIAFFFRMRPNSLLREMPRLSFTEEEYGDIALQGFPWASLGACACTRNFSRRNCSSLMPAMSGILSQETMRRFWCRFSPAAGLETAVRAGGLGA